MKIVSRAALAALACAAVSTAAQAHHSFAMFDAGKEVTLVGTVKTWEPVNPHAFLGVSVVTPAGESRDWSVELGAIGGLLRSGIARDTFKPGDKVTVVVHPVKNGSPEGSFIRATLGSGKVLGAGGAG